VTSGRAELVQIEDGIHYLDSRRVNATNVSGVYLLVGDGVTLVETATTLIAPDIVEAALQLGFQESDIRRAIVTHIHLDHAGGTGWLTSRLPHLGIYVHERGLRHLEDPSALIESARTVYGDLERIKAIHGEILPVPSENLFPVRDTTLDIGAGRQLQIIDAPGHASHHLCVFDPQSGCLFSGEAVGHNHPEIGVLQPAVAPPGFDFEASLQTIRRIRDLGPTTICFSQFGHRRDSSFVLDEAERQLQEYRDFVLARLQRGLSTEQIMDEIADLYLRDVLEAYPDVRKQHGEFLRSMLISVVVGYEIYFRRSGKLD
jgi:glyoxylase-like metal-dependent hydrolase (beta-lactamase superfamily II)